MEERSVFPSSNLVNRRGIEVDEDRTRDMLLTGSLVEEGFVGARIANVYLSVRAAIRPETVLEKISGEED